MRIFLGLVLIILMYSAVRQGVFSCDGSSKSQIEQHWDTKLEACKATCGIVDECNMYLADEENRELDQRRCTDFCMRQPDTKWVECTIKVKIDHGCGQTQAYRHCAQHLPSPKDDT